MTLQKFLEAEREAFQEHDSCHVGNCYCTSTSECEAKQLNFLTASHHRLIAKVREMVMEMDEMNGSMDVEGLVPYFSLNDLLTLLEVNDTTT